MNSPNLSKWVKHQEKRDENACFIESGLLGNSLLSYYTYRLKFFLVRTIVAALIFAIEVKILILGLGQEVFTYALGPRIIVGLLSAFWWACLEVMRSEIRDLKRNEKSYLIPRVIETWRTLATKLSEYIAVIGLLVIALVTLSFPEIVSGPLVLYWVSLIARSSIDISIRAYHSSVYATRRVYRPLFAILGVEILGLILFLSLKPSIGAWSVGVAAIISLIIGTWITYHYTKKTFNHLGYTKALKELKENPKPSYPLPKAITIVSSGIPLTLFRLDSIIGILLIAHYSWVTKSTQGAEAMGIGLSLAALAVCIPILQAAQEWSQLLYFDYKKLELKSHYWLKKRFESGLKYVGITVCLCLWLLTPILTKAVDNTWAWASWQLLCLLLATSMCGQQAMRIFSLGSQRELLLWGISLCLCLGLIYFFSNNPDPLSVFLTISIVLFAHASAMRLISKDSPKTREGYIKAPTQWLSSLKNQQLVHGGYIKIVEPPRLNRDGETHPKNNRNNPSPTEGELPPINYLRSQVAKELVRYSKHSLKITSLSKNIILFYCNAKPKNSAYRWRKESFDINNIKTKLTTEMGNIIQSFEVLSLKEDLNDKSQQSQETSPKEGKVKGAGVSLGIAPSLLLKTLSKIEPKLKACLNTPNNTKNLIGKNLLDKTTHGVSSESIQDQKDQISVISIEDICSACKNVFPAARVINLKNLVKLEGLSGHDSRNILSAALRYHSTLGLRSDPFCKNYDVTALDEDGALITIFAIPKGSPHSLIKQWRYNITEINLANAWDTQSQS